jgi:hypothetical protein
MSRIDSIGDGGGLQAITNAVKGKAGLRSGQLCVEAVIRHPAGHEDQRQAGDLTHLARHGAGKPQLAFFLSKQNPGW